MSVWSDFKEGVLNMDIKEQCWTDADSSDQRFCKDYGYIIKPSHGLLHETTVKSAWHDNENFRWPNKEVYQELIYFLFWLSNFSKAWGR